MHSNRVPNKSWCAVTAEVRARKAREPAAIRTVFGLRVWSISRTYTRTICNGNSPDIKISEESRIYNRRPVNYSGRAKFLAVKMSLHRGNAGSANKRERKRERRRGRFPWQRQRARPARVRVNYSTTSAESGERLIRNGNYSVSRVYAFTRMRVYSRFFGQKMAIICS